MSYANPPSPHALHALVAASTLQDDIDLSSDVVVAIAPPPPPADSRTARLNTVRACADSGGPNVSGGATHSRPSSASRSIRQRKTSPPCDDVSNQRSSLFFSFAFAFARAAAASEEEEDGASIVVRPAHATHSHSLPRCASDKCEGHLGSGSVPRRDARARFVSHDHSVTARSPRPPTASTAVSLLFSSPRPPEALGGAHARDWTSAALAGSFRTLPSSTSATASAPLWCPIASAPPESAAASASASASAAAAVSASASANLNARANTGDASNGVNARHGRSPPPPYPPHSRNRQMNTLPARSPDAAMDALARDVATAETSAA